MSKKTVRVALSAVVILGAFTLLMAQTVHQVTERPYTELKYASHAQCIEDKC